MAVGRIVQHAKVSKALASYCDGELASLVATARNGSVGVGGGSGLLDVGAVPVFVKQIPLTDLERADPRSTSNLFDLPMFCQYGMGGPSLNAWRELEANLTVTDLVLSVKAELFPLLYDWRVLPGRAPVAAEHADIDVTVAALDGHPAVRARLTALAEASWSLVLFFEYLPSPVRRWLSEDPVAKAGRVEWQLFEIVAALASCELLHMDAHVDNLRTDGERIYLTDFGLATSPRFDLTVHERAFVDRNATHDADYAAMRLVNWLVTDVCAVPSAGAAPYAARNEYVARCAGGDIPPEVPQVVSGIQARHAPAAARMNSFYWRLFDGEVHAQYQRRQRPSSLDPEDLTPASFE